MGHSFFLLAAIVSWVKGDQNPGLCGWSFGFHHAHRIRWLPWIRRRSVDDRFFWETVKQKKVDRGIFGPPQNIWQIGKMFNMDSCFFLTYDFYKYSRVAHENSQTLRDLQWGPTATKPEMLGFETPKTGLLKVSFRTQNHMLSTQLPRVQAYTHTERGSMDARHGFLQKEASFFGPVAFNVGATRRDIQGNIHSVWTMIAHVALEFRRIFLALLWHGSLQWGSVRGYKGSSR